MKIPTNNKLISWYEDLFEMGVKIGLLNYLNIGEYAESKNWSSKIWKIPYFKGK